MFIFMFKYLFQNNNLWFFFPSLIKYKIQHTLHTLHNAKSKYIKTYLLERKRRQLSNWEYEL